MKRYQTFKSQEDLVSFVWTHIKMQSTYTAAGNLNSTNVLNDREILDMIYEDLDEQPYSRRSPCIDLSSSLVEKLDISETAYALWLMYKDSLDGTDAASRFLAFILTLFSKVDAKLLVWVAKAGIHACARCGKFIAAGDEYEMTYSIMGSDIPGKIFFHEKCAVEAISDIKKQCIKDQEPCFKEPKDEELEMKQPEEMLKEEESEVEVDEEGQEDEKVEKEMI